MKNHSRRQEEYEELLSFAEEFSGVPLTSKQKRMVKGIVFGETFHTATLSNKKVVLAFAALYYGEKYTQKKEQD